MDTIIAFGLFIFRPKQVFISSYTYITFILNIQ